MMTMDVRKLVCENRGVDPDDTGLDAFDAKGNRIVELFGMIGEDVAYAYLAESDAGPDNNSAIHTIAELKLSEPVGVNEELNEYKKRTGVDIMKFFNDIKRAAPAKAKAMGFSYGGLGKGANYPDYE